ncbi:SH3 domain-containing protein [Noviherbaspirillum saxi]|uniref:SH3 domain-containing protein n=1 Tax=Noviherbaspirillum saxi TaxID=2320863 RepID=A0A3A3G3U5_9BURK|nr:SH3 domain-containing protein [Noviherbaspirillum saxi]RJF96096.1 SH3 domain-containing protein [Noviherbaspirillum saxi]
MKYLPLALAAMLASGMAYAESALTSRATDLQSHAQSDASSVASLPENTRVEVIARKGAWTQVKTAAGQSGWVRMLALKQENSAAAPSAAPVSGNPLGALNSLLSSGRTSNTATVTTGVRGLSEEDLQHAQANPAELNKAQRFSTDRNAAQAFADRSKLSPLKVDYLPEPQTAATRNMEGS